MRRTRRTKPRVLKPLIIVLCEGEKTEPSYLTGIFKNTSHHKDYAFNAYQPTDHSPFGIVKAACEEKRQALRDKISVKDIHVWAVFDRDGHGQIPEAFNMAKDKANKIKVAFSNVCFEEWVLLHYEATQKSFAHCDELVSYLKKYDSNYKKDDYCYKRLADKIQVALDNSSWLMQQVANDISRGTPLHEINPYTDVHKLVTFLLNPRESDH